MIKEISPIQLEKAGWGNFLSVTSKIISYFNFLSVPG